MSASPTTPTPLLATETVKSNARLSIGQHRPRVSPMSRAETRIWRTLQGLLVLVISVICALLFVDPPLGLHLLWNVLVPVAPLIVLLAPGVWRNICPLATTALVPHHLKRSGGRLPSVQLQGVFALVGLAALVILVPLRHAGFDRSGPLSGGLLLGLATVALLVGRLFAHKSGWCAGLCPVHPVERLYGSETLVRPKNAHCATCINCANPCPDSVPSLDPRRGKRQGWPRLVVGTAMLGGFPGFVAGWFAMPNLPPHLGFMQLETLYGLPLLGGAITAAVFVALQLLLPNRGQLLLRRLFAASAIGTYYYFRLPALLGWSQFGSDGVLIDLRDVLPQWTPLGLQIGVLVLIFGFLVVRRSTSRRWMIRPQIAVPTAV